MTKSKNCPQNPEVPHNSVDSGLEGYSRPVDTQVEYVRAEYLSLPQNNPFRVSSTLSEAQYERFSQTTVGRAYIRLFGYRRCTLRLEPESCIS